MSQKKRYFKYTKIGFSLTLNIRQKNLKLATVSQFNNFAIFKDSVQNTHNTYNGYPPMQEREALLLTQSHDLTALSVCKQADNSGWIIKLHTKSAENNEHTLATKREKTKRVFKTSDAALRWCKKVGFEEITVYL